MRVKLTVLTDPIPFGRYWYSESAKRVGRTIRNMFKPPPAFMRSPYRGHFAVTRSLVEGLRKTGVPSNYNPRTLSDVGEVVVVLSGLPALRQAIAMKRSGLVKRLLAGPNLVMFPSDARDLVCAQEVDVCITPGPLTCKIYIEDCPELEGRCAAWPAGVDTAFWAPGNHDAVRKTILFYDKPVHGPTDNPDKYATLLRQKGYQVVTLQYGDYTSAQYLKLLRESRLLVGFTGEESQGIAWTEAWSTDVPTFLWYKDRHSFNHPRSLGRSFHTSPAPQLTEDTGCFFRDVEEFRKAFDAWEAHGAQYSPRRWVLQNMSDEVCARHLCGLAGI